jgi:hypothetical protein
LQEYPLRPDRSQSVIVPKLVRCLLASSFSLVAREAKRNTQKSKRTANDSEFQDFQSFLERGAKKSTVHYRVRNVECQQFLQGHVSGNIRSRQWS